MAGRRGRMPGFVMTDEHRVKIQNSNILTYLISHICGDREMSSTQVAAGLGLLKKCLPDLTSTTHSGDKDNPIEINSTSYTPEEREKAALAIIRYREQPK